MQTSLIRLFCFGPSQWPLIAHGSIVEVVPGNFDSIGTGDIIAYRHHTRIICHRVLRLSPTNEPMEYFVKGDANLAADGWVPATAVLGKILTVNGKNLTSGWRGRLTRCLFLHAQIQCALVDAFQQSPLPKSLKLRLSLCVAGTGIMQRAISLLASPWLLFQPEHPRSKEIKS